MKNGVLCFPECLDNKFDDEDDEDDEDEQKFLHEDWETCITLEPRESNESFKIMEKFVYEVNDKSLKNKLNNALNNRKPFANFKNIVES